TLEDGTNVWPCFLQKKSRNCWRISEEETGISSSRFMNNATAGSCRPGITVCRPRSQGRGCDGQGSRPSPSASRIIGIRYPSSKMTHKDSSAPPTPHVHSQPGRRRSPPNLYRMTALTTSSVRSAMARTYQYADAHVDTAIAH